MSKAVQQRSKAAWGASGSAWPAAKEVVWRRMTGHTTEEQHRCRSRRNSGRCARVGEPVTRDGTLESPLVQRHVVSIHDRRRTASTGSVAQRRVLWRFSPDTFTHGSTFIRRLRQPLKTFISQQPTCRRLLQVTSFWQQPCSWYGCDTEL